MDPRNPSAAGREELMKRFEDQWRDLIPAKRYTILRVDGRAFHTLTRGMARPFDGYLMEAMDEVGVALCSQIQGAQFAYVQSDEVSVLLTDFGAMQQPWFGGVVQKMASVAASIACNAFNTRIPAVSSGRLAQFDARVFTVPSRHQAINYFLWRQGDCFRNAVSMAAEAAFSSKRLLNKGVREQMIMLEQEGGFSFERSYPQGARLGRVVTRVPEEAEVTYTRKDTGQTLTELVTRAPWGARPADWFDWDRGGFLEANVPAMPEEAIP